MTGIKDNEKRDEEAKSENKFFTRQVCVCAATQTLHYAQKAVQK